MFLGVRLVLQEQCACVCVCVCVGGGGLRYWSRARASHVWARRSTSTSLTVLTTRSVTHSRVGVVAAAVHAAQCGMRRRLHQQVCGGSGHHQCARDETADPGCARVQRRGRGGGGRTVVTRHALHRIDLTQLRKNGGKRGSRGAVTRGSVPARRVFDCLISCLTY